MGAADRLKRGTGSSGAKKSGISSLGSTALSMLQAPQQTVMHLIKGVRTGDVGQIGEAAKSAAKLALPGSASLPQFKQEPVSFTEAVGAKKLPFGVETIGSGALDPLTYLTVGTGAVAKSALGAVGRSLGDDAVKAVQRGGLKALSKEQQAAVRSNIFETAAKDVGEKKAEKLAKTQMRSLKSRARGGVGLHIPGTPLDVHVAGSFPEGPLATAARKSPKYSAARKTFTGEDLAEKARHAQGLGRVNEKEAATLAEKASRLFDETELGGRLGKRLEAAGEAPRTETGAISKVWKRMAVTYPGTVVNRLRQAAVYGILEGMRPDQWTRYMARGRKNYNAFEELAEEMGISGTEEVLQGLKAPEFAQRLAQKIGPKAAREELAFRQFAEAPTLYAGIESAAPKTPLGKTLEKGRLVKKGGKAIRAAGNAVEESSRRANFFNALENRYGSFEEAGAHTRRMLPGVKTHSEFERQIGKALPFWSAMRADWQSVLRMMGESPGRAALLTRSASGLGGTMNLPGGGEISFNQFKERHMPPLELAEMLDVPLHALRGDIHEALQAFSEMTGGPGVALIEQANDAWRRRNQDVPPREQLYGFLRDFNPYLQRLPSAVEKALSGREENITRADKSAIEALIQFATGVKTRTGPGEEDTTEQPGARPKTTKLSSVFD